jgi:hypothetical protein
MPKNKKKDESIHKAEDVKPVELGEAAEPEAPKAEEASAPEKPLSPEDEQAAREAAHEILVKRRDAGAVKRVGYVVNKPQSPEATATLQSCHFCGDTYTFQPGETKLDDVPDPPERTGATKMDLANHAIKAIKDLSLVWRWE